MLKSIIEIFTYGMYGCALSSIGCIMLNIELTNFRNIVITFTFACVIKKTLDYI